MKTPALYGGFLALLAAALFGVSMPLVQYFGVSLLGALTTATLLYAGIPLARRRARGRVGLRRSDLRRLLTVVAFGAVLGPVALAWGPTAHQRRQRLADVGHGRPMQLVKRSAQGCSRVQCIRHLGIS